MANQSSPSKVQRLILPPGVNILSIRISHFIQIVLLRLLEHTKHTWNQDCPHYVEKLVNLSLWSRHNELYPPRSFNRCSRLALLVAWQTGLTDEIRRLVDAASPGEPTFI